jgi:hypothetical protein
LRRRITIEEIDETYTFGILYVMNTTLTLRMDEELVQTAKTEANRRGKSVSQMVGDDLDGCSRFRHAPHHEIATPDWLQHDFGLCGPGPSEKRFLISLNLATKRSRMPGTSCAPKICRQILKAIVRHWRC